MVCLLSSSQLMKPCHTSSLDGLSDLNETQLTQSTSSNIYNVEYILPHDVCINTCAGLPSVSFNTISPHKVQLRQ